MSSLLICPLCQQPLHHQPGQYVCARQHSFDIAKAGHVNLLPVQHKRSKQPGDSKAMVQARRDWLALGHYQSIADAIAGYITPHSRVLDAGCGEGYYLSQIRQHRAISALGNDISKFAAAAAAKANPEATIMVASNKALPIADNSLDLVLCAFGFPVISEFARVLKPHGKVLLVHSTSKHLLSLRQALYCEVKQKPEPSLPSGLLCEHSQVIEQALPPLDAEQAVALAKMTPHWFRAKADKREAFSQQPPGNIHLSVRLQLCRLA